MEMMIKKILSFVYCDNKFLLLKNNPSDPVHGGDYWFVVTGALKENETYKDAVKREVLEETGLIVKDVFSLNWKFCYKINKKTCEEYAFISFADQSKIILNEEHVDYKWLDLNEFIKEIFWTSSKKILRKVLEKGIKK